MLCTSKNNGMLSPFADRTQPGSSYTNVSQYNSDSLKTGLPNHSERLIEPSALSVQPGL
jgi:hypothetical protein